MVKQKSVYFAAGWFSEEQNQAYNDAMKAVEANPTLDRKSTYVPLEHQYGGLRVDEHPELLHDKEWAIATYNGDIVGINQTDLTLVTYLPGEEDVGVGVEMGWAKAHGKPVVVVIPDKFFGNDINLMTFGIADNIIKMSELATFDFNNISFNYYDGAVY